MLAEELSLVLVVSACEGPFSCSMDAKMIEEAKSLLDDVCEMEMVMRQY
jgi:hypothetical protein